MAFELSKELKAAKSAVFQAKKDAKALAEVGVTPKEIAEAVKQFNTVWEQRSEVADKLEGYRGDERSLVREGRILITTVKQRIALALKWDLQENEWLRAKAGFGAGHSFTAPHVAEAARSLSEVIADPRWQKALRRRGVTAAQGKRLGEIANALDELGQSPSLRQAKLPQDMADLLRNVSYLRHAAATTWGTHSPKFLPYRAPIYVHKPEAIQPEAAESSDVAES